MTDTRRRDLERRLAGGDDEASAGLLALRQRSGEITQEQIELLAGLDYPPALAVLGAAPRPTSDLESWVRSLAGAGQQVWVCAAVAAARQVLPLFERRRGKKDPRPREAIDAAEAWQEEPGEESRERARVAAQAAYEVMGDLKLIDGTEAAAHYNTIVLAEVFRESRAAVQAALAAAESPERALTHAVLAGVAARERLALEETPRIPGKPSPLHERATQADRLGQLPELNTASSQAPVREAMRVAVIQHVLGRT